MIAARPVWLLDWSSFTAALALHGLAALALIAPSQGSGAGSFETAAISLNLIQTQIIDAVQDNAAPERQSTDEAVHEATGGPDDSVPSAGLREHDEVDYKQDTKPPGIKPAEPIKDRTVRSKASSQPAKASRKGGVQSRATSGGKAASGALSASRGAANSYAGVVRARLASARPRGLAGRGTAVVTFGLSRSGGLRYVRLLRSSGKNALDSAAMATVRRASPFPRPPSGMSLRQLSFSIPFYFK